MTEQVNRGRATSAEREALLARITPSADYGALADCDLVIEAVFEDRKVKAETIKKAQAVIGDKTIFASNTSTLPITLAGGRVQGPRALHRHPFLLAGRAHDAGRDHPRQEDRRPGARDRARFRARDPQDADRGQRLARLLRQPLRAQLHPGRPPDVHGGRAGGDDRERRRAWPACRSARSRSTTRSRSISAGRS